ncbi:hypothetical protein EFL26_10290 [Nocardioides pocheonensis]|uniref:Uncharacterized protein n=1 Tax=Nocardioides pocheonensis TaxID=661485 RepID=A0A3N0GQB1_9ACTN|nr:hypothetical protein EFL26_10290 [Nocardioides pocheonensis]
MQPSEPSPTEPSPIAWTDPQADTEPTTIDPLDQAAAALDAPSRRERRRASRGDKARRKAEKREARRAANQERSTAYTESRADETEPLAAAPAEALVARLPAIKPLYAAILSGLLAGLATVLLAFGASRGCESVRGTDSCGGGAGLVALVAILALEVLIGANLLKAWQISDPYSTSFLGVGLVTTIAMIGFLDNIDSPSMLYVIPLMTAAGFALSWWVTVRFIDENPMPSEVDAERGEQESTGEADTTQESPTDRDEDARA